MKRSVLLIYTGGTIGMQTDPHSGALVPFDFRHIYEEFPSLRRLGVEIDVLPFDPIDSSNASPELWVRLAEIIKENSAIMVTTIEQAERDRIIRNIKKYEEHKLADAVNAMVGGSPHFPSGYKLKKRTSDFIWIEYAIQDMTQGILIYKYPVVEGEQMLSLDSIIENSNEMLKNNVPGMFDNTYMTTSTAVRPGIEYKRYKGLEFAEVRGFWEVYNDYMGGPFVSHAFYSQDGQNVIVLQGFVYAPKFDKRQYLRQVESVIYSFEWAENEKEEQKD